ncbi:RNA polymerase sigma factor [Glaciecola sp. MF2-115]|uniref:RNA polymerase sigma factor n=1 Tax=Glaciecola sp. MF2-115 TaxID=3384827 RepID=UPI0039A1C988
MNPKLSVVNNTDIELAEKAQLEKSLIDASKQGDKLAFKGLYELHINRVYGLCFRLCADKSLAEDAAQEVFIQLWRKLDNFDGTSQFSTWLHSVTSNVTISYIRKQRGWWQKMFSIEHTIAMESEAEGSIADANLERYIYQLPERARWVFVLHAIEGYRHEEIAKILDMAVGTSKAQFHRAKSLIQGWMDDE